MIDLHDEFNLGFYSHKNINQRTYIELIAYCKHSQCSTNEVRSHMSSKQGSWSSMFTILIREWTISILHFHQRGKRNGIKQTPRNVLFIYGYISFFPFIYFNLFVQLLLGMCNSDRVLEYSAVTAMVDHENDDRGFFIFYKFRLVIAALWAAPWADCLACNMRREKSLGSDIWVSYIHIWLI